MPRVRCWSVCAVGNLLYGVGHGCCCCAAASDWWSIVELSKGWKRSDGKTGRSFPTQRVQYPVSSFPVLYIAQNCTLVRSVHCKALLCLLVPLFLVINEDEHIHTILNRRVLRFFFDCPLFQLIIVQAVHTNYIDCLRWFGNFVLTKVSPTLQVLPSLAHSHPHSHAAKISPMSLMRCPHASWPGSLRCLAVRFPSERRQ